ncbi:MAG: PDZ domain-containing protein, partial [Aureliella sp.]
ILAEQRITPANENARYNAPIRATVRVGGEDRVFIIDTGASPNFVDERLRSLCIKAVGERSVNSGHGQLNLSFFETAEAYVGSQLIPLSPVGVLDLNELSSVVGGDISGILGVAFLATAALGYQEVDKSFYTGSSYYRRFDATYPIDMESGYPRTSDVEIGISVDGFLVDTGMNDPLSLSKERFDAAKAAGLLYGIGSANFYSIGGTVKSRTGFLHSMTAWGHQFTNVPIHESSDEKVGLPLLERFDFRITCRNRTMEMSVNSGADQPFLYNRSGISLRSIDGTLVVESVEDDSPGHKAGLAESDTILAIDGMDVDSTWIGLSNAREALANPDATEVSLTITRNDSDRVAVLQLVSQDVGQ